MLETNNPYIDVMYACINSAENEYLGSIIKFTKLIIIQMKRYDYQLLF